MTTAVLSFEGDRTASFTTSFAAADVSSFRLVGTKGAVRVIVKGGDRGLLVGAEFAAGSKHLGSDEAAPFRVRVKPSQLKRHGKTRLGGVASLLDGRVTSLDEKKVRRCG